MLYKILVTVDYSKISKSVIDEAVTLAKTTGATLMMVHVFGEDESTSAVMPIYSDYPVFERYDYDSYQKNIEEYKLEGIKFLQEKVKEAKAAGVNAKFIQLAGNPGRAICKLADTWSADLILVGSRGLKGLKEMFLGSVSNYITHHAPCSVLIVRTAADSSPPSFEEEKTENSKI